MGSRSLGLLVAAAFAVLVAAPASAGAAELKDPVDQWLPSSDGATWVYAWSDSSYAPRTIERYRLTSSAGTTFRINWNSTDQDLGNGGNAIAAEGVMDFQRTDAGLVNLNWSSSPPPEEMPILCANANGCGNSVAGTFYMLIWGNRSPVLAEPLLRSTSWSSLGGAGNDVGSSSRYLGLRTVKVPAFPNGVTAALVETQITQAGALGDPYGSGVRRVWWVRGIGPVKIDFFHAGGETEGSELQSTNLTRRKPPPDANYLPVNRGDRAVYRWRNSRWMKKWSTQQFDVTDVVNNTSRVDVKRRSGPIAVAGSYVFAQRLSGITNLAANTKAATRARFPALGPSSLSRSQRRHLFTPYDLMSWGFNPILPAFPEKGQLWRANKNSRDYSIFGVSGFTKIVGTERVTVAGKRYRALEVVSRMRQAGYAFGSGTRTMWFVKNKGLVKLVFRHNDGSVSTVERLR
jgi:hypothetical protein